MDVVSQGRNVKVFTVPMISWEPLINLQLRTSLRRPGDPPAGLNYYPNDGGPTQILNNGDDTVTLAPLPLTDYLVDRFRRTTKDFAAYRAYDLAVRSEGARGAAGSVHYTIRTGGSRRRTGAELLLNAEEFENGMKGGLQLQLNGGEASYNRRERHVRRQHLQLNNVLDAFGNSHGDSTLGRTVTKIFNNEFLLEPFDLFRQRGVPLTRIDLSGYGASTFSNWLNPTAAFAQTSQARFDVFVGRCAHEVIQVKSIIYPWGIKVVRTITIFRVGSGYVYRCRLRLAGREQWRFDFRYWVNKTPPTRSRWSPRSTSIRESSRASSTFRTSSRPTRLPPWRDMVCPPTRTSSTKTAFVSPTPPPTVRSASNLQPVYFDADVEIENVCRDSPRRRWRDSDKKVVPSKRSSGTCRSRRGGFRSATRRSEI